MWKGLLKVVAGVTLAAVALAIVPGCATLNPQPPVEHFANKLADEAVIPAVREGLTQGVQQLALQAGAQGINPAYVVKFSGKWVTGVEGEASVGVEGIAGQLQVSTAASDKTESSPQAQEPAVPAVQPASASPTWTDVLQAVRAADAHRGSQIGELQNEITALCDRVNMLAPAVTEPRTTVPGAP